MSAGKLKKSVEKVSKLEGMARNGNAKASERRHRTRVWFGTPFSRTYVRSSKTTHQAKTVRWEFLEWEVNLPAALQLLKRSGKLKSPHSINKFQHLNLESISRLEAA